MRIGIIGVGKMGELHLQKYLSCPDVSVSGIYDIDPLRVEALSAKYGVPGFKDLGELLFDVDAATVASPTATHYQVGRQALEAGVGILVEKPIADTVERAEELVRLARAKGLVLQVGLIERFRFLALAGEIALGPVRYIEAYRLSSQLARDRSVDLVADLMIHDLDLALSLMGEDPHSVSAVGIPVITDDIDMANVRMEFPRGGVVNLNVSWVSLEAQRKFRVFFTDAYASMDFISNSVKVLARNRERKIELVRKDSKEVDPLREQIVDFIDCVRTGRRPVVTGEDGLRALRFAKVISEKIHERAGIPHGVEAVDRRG